jgi:predicted transcriptional regulator
MQLGQSRSRLTPPLGELEIAVLQYLWAAAAERDARAVHASLAARRITLSTVQATLERLHRKALLERTKAGRAYRYRAAVSRDSLIGAFIRDLSVALAEGELEPVVSGFMELVGEADPRLLERLEKRAAELRRKERE